MIALGSCASSSSSRTVYLLGRFPAPHSKPQLASSLRSAGHVVAPAMTSDVDLVVVGLGWAKSLLDAHDIPAMLVHDDAGGWEGGLLVPAWARAKLFVRREDLQRSAAVLTDHMTAIWREP